MLSMRSVPFFGLIKAIVYHDHKGRLIQVANWFLIYQCQKGMTRYMYDLEYFIGLMVNFFCSTKGQPSSPNGTLGHVTLEPEEVGSIYMLRLILLTSSGTHDHCSSTK